jgi:hypothetical protein
MRISIITLTLDSPRYFDEAVGSVEREENVELEHIVVHDGDETFTRCSSINAAPGIGGRPRACCWGQG